MALSYPGADEEVKGGRVPSLTFQEAKPGYLRLSEVWSVGAM